MPLGRYTIEFERLDYAKRTDTLGLTPGLPVDMTVRLAASPATLEPIRLAVGSTVLFTEGFYDRRTVRQDDALFFTAQDIEELQPVVLTDLMDVVPLVRVVDQAGGRKIIQFRPGPTTRSGRNCQPAVFIDAVPVHDRMAGLPRLDDFNRVDPSDVAGIELLFGPNTPLKYSETSCGAVLIWMKSLVRR